jgi:hypothetical protein
MFFMDRRYLWFISAAMLDYLRRMAGRHHHRLADPANVPFEVATSLFQESRKWRAVLKLPNGSWQ